MNVREKNVNLIKFAKPYFVYSFRDSYFRDVTTFDFFL